MLHLRHMPGARPSWRRRTRRAGTLLMTLTAAIAATSCSGHAVARHSSVHLMARTRPPALTTSVLSGGPDALADAVAGKLLSSAPVVVVTGATSPAGLAAAASRARKAHAPLLLASARRPSARGSNASAGLRAEVRALHPRAVLAIGISRSVLAAQLPGTRVLTSPAALPKTSAPPPLRHVVLLVHQGSPATMAAAATAAVAGATVIRVRGFDPRTDPDAVADLAAARPSRVIAVGARFGPPSTLAARVAVGVTGMQLPGGGQVMFPGRRLVALYGHPGSAALGALGQQGLAASIARVRRVAAQYRRLSGVPVVPTFEIITTVAQGSPGRNGSYSYETPLSVLRPWVRAATAAHMYVVLDLQPGRDNLLTQARRYQALLERPNVGLALDPEWKLQPRQKPLRQIGGVHIAEVNSVVRWLAALTAHRHLPQKLLVLHQFQLTMLLGERGLDTHEDDLAIVIHMDGQGTPGNKEQTWRAVTGAAPRGVFFGWKDFYVKDHPMLGPRQTMEHRPRPAMISYQ